MVCTTFMGKKCSYWGAGESLHAVFSSHLGAMLSAGELSPRLLVESGVQARFGEYARHCEIFIFRNLTTSICLFLWGCFVVFNISVIPYEKYCDLYAI